MQIEETQDMVQLPGKSFAYFRWGQSNVKSEMQEKHVIVGELHNLYSSILKVCVYIHYNAIGILSVKSDVWKL